MKTTRKFGAISFVARSDGRYVVAGKVAANNIAGAIGRAGDLQETLIKELTPRVGAVAFEFVGGGQGNATERIRLSKFGNVPDDRAICAAIEAALESSAISETEAAPEVRVRNHLAPTARRAG